MTTGTTTGMTTVTTTGTTTETEERITMTGSANGDGLGRAPLEQKDAAELFAALPEQDPPAMERLRDRLARRAEAEGVLDVAYRTLDSPVGPLLLAATEQGLVRVAFGVQDHEAVLRQLADRISPRVLYAPARLDEASRQLDGYFTGRLRRFELPLDQRLSTGFRRSVLDRLRDIGYGRTLSYAQVAAAAGSPRAVRAAGTACATNPLPLVVPCHRVVRSDGTPGRYAGGEAAKRALLALESGA
ncbi:methylated-DNA--[protein]-cysteine S-methyltransferase [Actinacidiphila yeochonensis]|uniref:methylated-DNA--[protein]-cysteine S-methyltransferase n=1 Tax=Actinacidiphila yeochonensis TaxID=89050 RepID=UPI000B33E54A|nr:methylated-DNA--[protein]-cysteine S-methyltransferase [Actinacidiphila yeochonensis]